MFGVRILLVLTAYSVVLLEVYSGAINGPQWWILPGALVIALVCALAFFGLPSPGSPPPPKPASATIFQWLIVVIVGLAFAWFANYFGRDLLPALACANPAAGG
ncbi:MAG TPA: hypothetical protein VNH64_08225 [Parvularculaceae bacterium]|nr:hypothetical protein [Parvularculaceae bacterium]